MTEQLWALLADKIFSPIYVTYLTSFSVEAIDANIFFWKAGILQASILFKDVETFYDIESIEVKKYSGRIANQIRQ